MHSRQCGWKPCVNMLAISLLLECLHTDTCIHCCVRNRISIQTRPGNLPPPSLPASSMKIERDTTLLFLPLQQAEHLDLIYSINALTYPQSNLTSLPPLLYFSKHHHRLNSVDAVKARPTTALASACAPKTRINTTPLNTA